VNEFDEHNHLIVLVVVGVTDRLNTSQVVLINEDGLLAGNHQIETSATKPPDPALIHHTGTKNPSHRLFSRLHSIID